MLLTEQDRLRSTLSYQILDTGREEPYDSLVTLVARTLRVPRVLLVFFGGSRAWTKAAYGLPLRQDDGDFADGIAAFEHCEILESSDPARPGAGAWRKLAGLGTGEGAYAACRIPSRDGFALGALIAADGVPRVFSNDDLTTLRSVARQVAAQLELRREEARQHLVTPTSRALRLDDPARLRSALENDEFVLHYQPLVALDTRQVYGVEALIRWQHPEWGLVSPDRFLPMLESSSLMSAVGRWARERAVLDVLSLERDLGVRQSVALNVSAREFDAPGFATSFAELVNTTGIDPAWVTLELTESARLGDADVSVRELHLARSLGAQVVLDDYGTGYANLAALLNMPLTGVKIDRMFTTRLREARVQRMLSSVLGFCEASALDVVLEGIETESQRSIALELGFDRGQGFLFSAPLALSSLRQLLTLAPRTTPGRISF